jgi:hypothetical protein
MFYTGIRCGRLIRGRWTADIGIVEGLNDIFERLDSFYPMYKAD